MAAYIRFYQLDASPFGDGDSQLGLVLGTPSLRGALAKVKQGLSEDSPRICLTGSAGIGKTSFCRALPKLLGDAAQVAVILNPSKPWRDIRATIAKRYKLAGGAISRRALLAAREDAKRLVLIIDQAESLSHESLDHLDILLQYKCDDGKQLLHCVMLADLDGVSSGTETPLLWWLDRFTTLQLQFSPIPVEGLRHYVEKHLARAGWAGGELFTEEALIAVHRNTGGVPGAINDLCQRILVEGGAREIRPISGDFIESLYGDSGAEEPSIAKPELSADLSIGDFSTQQTAQEMLDDLSFEPPSSDAETRGAREQLPEPAADIASLIITQDSAELLEVAPNVQARGQGSLGLELEHEHEHEPQDGEPMAVYGHTRNFKGAPVGMSNHAAVARRRRSPVSTLIGLGVAGWIAYALYSNVPVPTELIESAEVKIAEVIEQQTGFEFESKPEQEVKKVSSLAPSILDRPDMLAADPKLDIVALPEAEETLAAEAAEVASTDDAVQLSSGVETDEAADPLSEGAAASQTASSRISKTITSEPIVVNEYTAIPEAATVKPSPAVVVAPVREPESAPASPAKLAPVPLPAWEPESVIETEPDAEPELEPEPEPDTLQQPETDSAIEATELQ